MTPRHIFKRILSIRLFNTPGKQNTKWNKQAQDKWWSFSSIRRANRASSNERNRVSVRHLVSIDWPIFERVTMKGTERPIFHSGMCFVRYIPETVSDVNRKWPIWMCHCWRNITYFHFVSRFFTLFKCFRCSHRSLRDTRTFIVVVVNENDVMFEPNNGAWTRIMKQKPRQKREKNPEKFVVSLFSRTRAIYNDIFLCSCGSNTKQILNIQRSELWTVTFHLVVEWVLKLTFGSGQCHRRTVCTRTKFMYRVLLL